MKNVVAIFGSSLPQEGDDEYALALELGRELANAGFVVCNGGYGGIMEASARGAKLAGGKTIGVTCKTFQHRAPNRWIDECVEMDDLIGRLLQLLSLGNAYVVLKGGTGTLLELAAAWEMMNKKMMQQKSIVLMGEFWTGVVETVQAELNAAGVQETAQLILRAENAKQCAAILRQIVEKEEP
jgi:uncharacterized protein (TIGR00730 family)